MVVKLVRISAVACSLTTEMRRFQSTSSRMASNDTCPPSPVWRRDLNPLRGRPSPPPKFEIRLALARYEMHSTVGTPPGSVVGDACGLATGDAAIGLPAGDASAVGDGGQVGTMVDSMIGPTGDAISSGAGLASLVATGDAASAPVGLASAVTAMSVTSVIGEPSRTVGLASTVTAGMVNAADVAVASGVATTGDASVIGLGDASISTAGVASSVAADGDAGTDATSAGLASGVATGLAKDV